jgi:hypothetical protein
MSNQDSSEDGFSPFFELGGGPRCFFGTICRTGVMLAVLTSFGWVVSGVRRCTGRSVAVSDASSSSDSFATTFNAVNVP